MVSHISADKEAETTIRDDHDLQRPIPLALLLPARPCFLKVPLTTATS